ncbi:MAG: glycosyltransferase [Candidatus Sericytochromatia bacterium]|nr:glycosyltransferase [Candidatus Sericytochromatia bacterium]
MMKFESPSQATLRAALNRGGPLPPIAMVSVHGDPSAPIGTEGAGGQNVYVRELSRALRQLGHPIHVFTRAHGALEAPEAVDLAGVTVVRIPCGEPGHVGRDELFSHLPEFVARVADWAGARHLSVPIVHSHYWLSGWVGMALARRWHAAHVHTAHSLGAVKQEALGTDGSPNPVRIEVEDEIAEQADALVATSPADLIARGRHYRATGKPEVIPCGYSPAVFNASGREAARVRWGLRPTTPVLAYVGRFDSGKGLDTLMEAFDLLAAETDARLLLAGGFMPGGADELEHDRLRAWVAERPWADRVHWLGRLDAPDVADVYRAASVVVVPSRYESFGMVALEAMACGTPVVASDVGGLRQTVVHRETGLLVPVGDATALAQSCKLLLEDPVLWQRVSSFAEQTARRCYTWPQVADRMSALYARVTGDQR